MYYRQKLNSLNIFIEVVMKLDNKFHKLAIKTRYSNKNNKTKCYYRYISYYSKQIPINRKYYDSNDIISLEIDSIQQCKETKPNKKKLKNRTYYIYNKLYYFVKDCCFNNIMR